MYTSGPSDFDDELYDMNEKEKEQRVKDLWMITFNLLNMASKSVKLYNEISKEFVVYTDGNFEKLTEKQMLKMFGTVEDLEYKEKDTYTAVPKWYIILPTSKFSIFWNLVIVLLLIYIATVLPYRIAFLEETSLGWLIWDYITDVIFLADLFITCFSAYHTSDGTVEVRFGKIV